MLDPRIRRATAADVAAIVAMLADDVLGAARESPDDLAPYLAAFAVIDADAQQRLMLAERGGRVVGSGHPRVTDEDGQPIPAIPRTCG